MSHPGRDLLQMAPAAWVEFHRLNQPRELVKFESAFGRVLAAARSLARREVLHAQRLARAPHHRSHRRGDWWSSGSRSSGNDPAISARQLLLKRPYPLAQAALEGSTVPRLVPTRKACKCSFSLSQMETQDGRGQVLVIRAARTGGAASLRLCGCRSSAIPHRVPPAVYEPCPSRRRVKPRLGRRPGDER